MDFANAYPDSATVCAEGSKSKAINTFFIIVHLYFLEILQQRKTLPGS